MKQVRLNVAALVLVLALKAREARGDHFSFMEQTGPANPLAGFSSPYNFAAPALADIDADGDFDLVAGHSDYVYNPYISGYSYSGQFLHYLNTGGASNPVFAEQTGGANPLNGIFTATYLSPAMVDIDNDGDQDLFSADNSGSPIRYFRNQGSPSAPSFSEVTGTPNPLYGASGSYLAPAFVDIDADGDFDLFLGDQSGYFRFFQNQGNASSPNFVELTGPSNPLYGAYAGSYYSAPTFADIDGDGLKDAVLASNNGDLLFYKNTGTPSAPVLIQQNGLENPFYGVALSGYNRLAAADLDGDGKPEVVVGGYDTYTNQGNLRLFKYTLNTPTTTPTATETATPVFSETPTATETPFVTETPTATETPVVSETPTSTGSPSSTETAVLSATPSSTETPSFTESASPTRSATETATPSISPSASPSGTGTPTQTPSATQSNSPTASPSATPSFTPSETPSVTPSATPSVTPSNSPSPTDTPSEIPTQTGTPTVTPVFSATAGPATAPSGLGKPVFGPVPLRTGRALKLYPDRPAKSSHWRIYNMAGEQVAEVRGGAGGHEWLATGLAPGVYWIELSLEYEDGTASKRTHKIVLSP